MSRLRAAPYSLLKDENIFAKVIAVNNYGESALSDAGNGALI